MFRYRLNDLGDGHSVYTVWPDIQNPPYGTGKSRREAVESLFAQSDYQYQALPSEYVVGVLKDHYLIWHSRDDGNSDYAVGHGETLSQALFSVHGVEPGEMAAEWDSPNWVISGGGLVVKDKTFLGAYHGIQKAAKELLNSSDEELLDRIEGNWAFVNILKERLFRDTETFKLTLTGHPEQVERRIQDAIKRRHRKG